MTSTRVCLPQRCLAPMLIPADSAYIFVGGLDFGLTEGDVITVFSQCVQWHSLRLWLTRQIW